MSPGTPAARPPWPAMIALLLLALALVKPQLGHDAFHHDEAFSMIAAGIHRADPGPASAVVAAIEARSAEQALGWPLLLSWWARVAGWSELSARLIPLFAGLLALAAVYRAGAEFFGPRAGLFASLLLAGSAFFLTYFTVARAFSLVTLFAAVCLPSYWRIALFARRPGPGAQAAFLLGSLGLLFSHYFGALLLPALMLYHLLFARKSRRWWRAPVLVGLACLPAALQLPILLRGLQNTLASEILGDKAMPAGDVLERFLRFLVNDLLHPAGATGDVLLVLLAIALAALTVVMLRRGTSPSPWQYLLFVALALLTVILAANALVQAMVPNRMRYLIALWPLTALPAGAALHRLAFNRPRLAAALLTLWLALGAYTTLATPFRYEADYLFRSDIHRMFRVMRARQAETDFLVLDSRVEGRDPGRVYTKALGLPYKIIYRDREAPLASVAPVHAQYTYAWMLFHARDQADMDALAAELGRVQCEVVHEGWGLMLARHALTPAHCPGSPVRLDMERGIQLIEPEVILSDGLLRFYAGLRSADDYLLAHYSLALHVIDPRTGERAAQGDVGVGPGRFVALRSDIDLSALPPGDYELHLALYDWQTGERLSARDLQTGAVGDMHVLHRFRHG